jgi:hypothetical protein
MSKRMKTKLSFYDHHRQGYGHMPIEDDAEFMVGDYGDGSGGVSELGEFKITLISLQSRQLRGWPMLSPQLHVFGDATGALKEALDAGLSDVMAQEYRNKDDFARALIEIGIADRSDFPIGHKPVCPCCGKSTQTATESCAPHAANSTPPLHTGDTDE